MRFTAVAEVHRPPSTDNEERLLAQASGQHAFENTDPGEAPVKLSARRGDTLVSKPKMHSAQRKVLGGIPMEEAECLEPLLTSVPDAPLDSKPMAGNRIRNRSRGSTERSDWSTCVTSPALSRYSVTQLHLDSQVSSYQSQPDRSRYPMSDNIPHRQAEPPGNQTVPDVVVQIDTPGRKVCFHDNQTVSHGNKNNAVQTAPTSGRRSELLIIKPVSAEYAERRKSKERSLLEVSLQTRQSLAHIDHPEYTGSRPESGEAIVVGTIGSAAPWFLTGWAHDVEIKFMIDTGCQVTILSTTMFQCMCAVNPEVRSALQTCRRRLASADSSPLTVQGQLELDIVFPGLCCKMLFVVANIVSDCLLGTEALQSYLPHQLDLQTGQLWADGWSTLQLHQHRLTPDMDGLLTTPVVIPADSEIVAKFSVSGTRPQGCVLVEPARQLIEEYGIIVGHTLVDRFVGFGQCIDCKPERRGRGTPRSDIYW